jgi:DNA-binding NtrC family response regulator
MRVISQDAALQGRDSSHMAKKSTAVRVLVVDDEPLIRWSMSETLTDLGHDVVEAGDAQAALAAVSGATVPFDVVLLDLRLPDTSDLSLLSSLRRLTPHTQVIVMTAFGTADILQSAIDLGAFRVVAKPFEVNELASLVQKAHASRSA